MPTAPGLSWLWALINQSGLIPRLIPKKKKKTLKRGQGVPSLNWCFKKAFSVLQIWFLAKSPSCKSPYRFPVGLSVFNSRLSLSRTELAGHSHQVFCPGPYPPKWQDVWHTFLLAKGVDNRTRGSKMTKIEQTPKCHGTQPPFHSSAFFSQLTMKKNSWKSFASINYSANAKHSLKKKQTQCGVRWHDRDRRYSANTQKNG